MTRSRGTRRRAGASALVELLGQVRDSSEERCRATAVLEHWLKACPAGPLAPGPEAESVLAALAEGWSAAAIHAVAAGPVTVAEASESIGEPDRELAAMSRVFAAMEGVGLIASASGTDGEERKEATDWLRSAIGPLAAAARLEAADGRDGATPIDELDVEAAFLLALPLVKGLPAEMSSACRLTVTVPGRRPHLAGVAVLIDRGEIVSVTTDLTIWSETFASGAALDWIDTLIDPTAAKLDVSGALEVPLALLAGLHETLFAVPVT
jgi:hypothetical protein